MSNSKSCLQNGFKSLPQISNLVSSTNVKSFGQTLASQITNSSYLHLILVKTSNKAESWLNLKLLGEISCPQDTRSEWIKELFIQHTHNIQHCASHETAEPRYFWYSVAPCSATFQLIAISDRIAMNLKSNPSRITCTQVEYCSSRRFVWSVDGIAIWVCPSLRRRVQSSWFE